MVGPGRRPGPGGGLGVGPPFKLLFEGEGQLHKVVLETGGQALSHRPPSRGNASSRFLTGEMNGRAAHLWAGSAWRAICLARREETVL